MQLRSYAHPAEAVQGAGVIKTIPLATSEKQASSPLDFSLADFT